MREIKVISDACGNISTESGLYPARGGWDRFPSTQTRGNTGRARGLEGNLGA